MAWIFSLWIETESNAQKKVVLAYFEGKSIQIKEENYTISTYPDGMVTVDKISKKGVYTQEIANELTAVGFEFYRLLKAAPDFRYALVGVEVDDWRSWADLEEIPTDMGLTKGFVISAAAYHALGNPVPVEPFRKNYLWTPYQGETLVEL
jgi:hypothetical protein